MSKSSITSLTISKARGAALIDLRNCELLRVLAATGPKPSSKLSELARKCGDHAARPKRFRVSHLAGLAAAAATALLIGLGIFDRPADEPSLAYLQEAVESQHAASLRHTMVSQVETPTFDPKAIRAATRISIPILPQGWSISDVQVFPSDFGPALQLSIRTSDGQALGLFAAHAELGAPSTPASARVSSDTLISWANSGNTYVLTGAIPQDDLLRVAHDLADNRLF